jgi:predicted nuclease of restriction endonuclease-like (RecB) superfamily
MRQLNQQHFSEITQLIQNARYKTLQTVNAALIELYWQIGKTICNRIASDGWGKAVVKVLADYIAQHEPDAQGFSDKNLWRMKQFYESYQDKPDLQPLTRQVSWTHNLLIFSKTKSDEEHFFYLQLAKQERLGSRELERHINSGHFERTMRSNQKLSAVLRELPQNVTNVFKDTYVFEFLHLPEKFSESDLQKGLLKNLKKFILELGNDFIFMGEEFRLQVGNKDFELDLLFFHRDLCCLVAFELKIDDFKPDYIGQINFYLEALDRDVRKPHENPSIGVLLCKSKDEEIVEYAMSRQLSPTLVADYETKFIDKRLLKGKLQDWFDHYDKDVDKL